MASTHEVNESMRDLGLSVTFCTDCDSVCTGEVVVLEGAELCPACAFAAASHTLSALLYPAWAPLPSSLRAAEEALRAVRPLLALVEARVRTERTKVAP